jgi:hypothetical protein
MDEHRLDGNAAGGLLGEIFPFEMTTAQVTCANCQLRRALAGRADNGLWTRHGYDRALCFVRQRPHPCRSRAGTIPARHKGCQVPTGRGSLTGLPLACPRLRCPGCGLLLRSGRSAGTGVDDIPDGRGVLGEVLRVGVDGTDKEINDAEYGDPPEGYDFLVTGHESFGRVLKAGPNVQGLQPGDYVVATVRRPGTNIRCLSR